MKVSNQFKKDLEKAKKAERIARYVLQIEQLGNIESEWDYNNMHLFYDVSDKEEFYHRGDIECNEQLWDSKTYIDVKDDGCIYRTGNLLAEDKVYWRKGYMQDGFMRRANYDYVAYVSQPDKKIYILDFKTWKECYKKGKYKTIQHPEQITYAYLMSLKDAKKLGVLLAEIDYEEDNFIYEGDNIPHAINVKFYKYINLIS